MNTLLIIFVTIYATLIAQVLIKELADRNERTIDNIILFMIFAPVIVMVDIVDYWRQETKRWKEYDSEFKNRKQ